MTIASMKRRVERLERAAKKRSATDTSALSRITLATTGKVSTTGHTWSHESETTRWCVRCGTIERTEMLAGELRRSWARPGATSNKELVDNIVQAEPLCRPPELTERQKAAVMAIAQLARLNSSASTVISDRLCELGLGHEWPPPPKGGPRR